MVSFVPCMCSILIIIHAAQARILTLIVVTDCLFNTVCQNEIHPPYLPVPTNETLSLNCLSNKSVSYSWLKSDRDDLVHVDGDGVLLNGSELMITNFHGSRHSGRYYCLTSQYNKTYASCPAIVKHASKLFVIIVMYLLVI